MFVAAMIEYGGSVSLGKTAVAMSREAAITAAVALAVAEGAEDERHVRDELTESGHYTGDGAEGGYTVAVGEATGAGVLAVGWSEADGAFLGSGSAGNCCHGDTPADVFGQLLDIEASWKASPGER